MFILIRFIRLLYSLLQVLGPAEPSEPEQVERISGGYPQHHEKEYQRRPRPRRAPGECAATIRAPRGQGNVPQTEVQAEV